MSDELGSGLIGLTSSDIYTAGSALYSIPKTGGEWSVVVPDQGVGQSRFATTAANVFLSLGVADRLLYVFSPSSGLVPFPGAPPAQQQGTFVATSGAFVYWSRFSAASQSTEYYRAPAGGGAPLFLGSIPQDVSFRDFAVANGCLYVRTPSVQELCPNEVVRQFTGSSGGVLGDGNELFVAAPEGVLRSIGGASPLILARTIDEGTRTLALDEDFVYYVDGHSEFMNCGTSWSIRRVPRRGGAAETLVPPPQCPTGLAVDERALYWSNAQGLWKLAK